MPRCNCIDTISKRVQDYHNENSLRAGEHIHRISCREEMILMGKSRCSTFSHFDTEFKKAGREKNRKETLNVQHKCCPYCGEIYDPTCPRCDKPLPDGEPICPDCGDVSGSDRKYYIQGNTLPKEETHG